MPFDVGIAAAREQPQHDARCSRSRSAAAREQPQRLVLPLAIAAAREQPQRDAWCSRSGDRTGPLRLLAPRVSVWRATGSTRNVGRTLERLEPSSSSRQRGRQPFVTRSTRDASSAPRRAKFSGVPSRPRPVSVPEYLPVISDVLDVDAGAGQRRASLVHHEQRKPHRQTRVALAHISSFESGRVTRSDRFSTGDRAAGAA
jgi:hypothetical protein